MEEGDYIRVLLIEDNLGDAKFINEMINEARDFRYKFDHAFRLSTGLEYIQKKKYDIILLDLGLPDSIGLETLLEVHSAAESTPIVIMTGLDDDELGLKAVQLGAQDYIIKLQIDSNLLIRSIRYAIERKKISQKLIESQTNLAEAQKIAHLGNYEVLPSGNWITASEEACRILDRDPALGTIDMNEYLFELIHPEDRDSVKCLVEKVIKDKVPVEMDFRAVMPNGDLKYIHNIIRPVLDSSSGEVTKHFGIIMDITGQKLNEKALIESEELSRAVFEQAAVGIALIALDGRFFSVNDRFCQITGRLREDLLGLTVSDITHPDDLQRDVEFLQRLRDKEINAYSLEKRYIRQDGFYVWANITVSSMYSSNGQLKYFLDVVEDITERKWAEEARLQSEETAHAFMTAITDSAMTIDSTGLILAGNETAANRFGKHLDRFIGTNFFNYLPEDIIHLWKEKLSQLLKTSMPVSFEDERFGRTSDNILYPIFNSRGEVTRIAVLAIDVTERKITEIALRESEKRLSTIFKESPSAIAIIRIRDSFILDVNAAFERLTGYSRKDILNRSLDQLNIFSNQADRVKLSKTIGQKGEVRNYEMNFLAKDRSNITVLLSAIQMEVAGEQSFLVVIHDITERKKALEQIEKYVEELQQNKTLLEESAKELSLLNQKLNESNLNKDKFFSILAHDLRSPFSALLGFAEFLSNHIEELTEDEIKEFSQRIYKSLNNLFKLIEDLLQWSRIQTGRIDYAPVKFDLHRVADETLEIFQVNSSQKEIEVKNNIARNSFVFADEDMISRVIGNLLSNAIKFTPRKGEITLSAAEKEGFLQFTISDTGVGISSDNMQRLFKIEQTLTTEGTEKERGTGLGLILCKEFVEINHGSISVKSEPGKGSNFIILLPKP
jgi:PAS domain S-box-containing protein